MKYLAHSGLVFCLTFLFTDFILFAQFEGQRSMFAGLVSVRRKQDNSTVWVLFKLVSYTEK